MVLHRDTVASTNKTSRNKRERDVGTNAALTYKGDWSYDCMFFPRWPVYQQRSSTEPKKSNWCKDEEVEMDEEEGKKRRTEEEECAFGRRKIIFRTWASIGANNSSNFFKSDFKWHYICSEA